MLRFLARALGLVLIAASFVGLVIDAMRSIANSAVQFKPLGELAFHLFPRSFPLLEPAVTRHVHPWLWDPVLINLLLLPAALVGLVIGLLLLWVGQRPAEAIGYRAEA